MITQSRLKELLSYNEKSGEFVWKISRGRNAKIGDLAGCKNLNGYWIIGVDHRPYRAHRLAWLFVFGLWPKADIDHINGVRTDNRIGNLREATRSENLANKKCQSNNRCGVKGVYLHHDGRFRAQVRMNGKNIHLGLFDTAEQANSAYFEKAKQLFGVFARSE